MGRGRRAFLSTTISPLGNSARPLRGVAPAAAGLQGWPAIVSVGVSCPYDGADYVLPMTGQRFGKPGPYGWVGSLTIAGLSRDWRRHCRGPTKEAFAGIKSYVSARAYELSAGVDSRCTCCGAGRSISRSTLLANVKHSSMRLAAGSALRAASNEYLRGE